MTTFKGLFVDKYSLHGEFGYHTWILQDKLGGGFKYLYVLPLGPGEDEPIFDEHIFPTRLKPPTSKLVNNHRDRKSPTVTGVIPLSNGFFMAYKWG